MLLELDNVPFDHFRSFTPTESSITYNTRFTSPLVPIVRMLEALFNDALVNKTGHEQMVDIERCVKAYILLLLDIGRYMDPKYKQKKDDALAGKVVAAQLHFLHRSSSWIRGTGIREFLSDWHHRSKKIPPRQTGN